MADLRIARGLDYYTGTVYETRMQGFESLGSICSGGRYDSLASDGRTTYPGVGISFGVTRTLGAAVRAGPDTPRAGPAPTSASWLWCRTRTSAQPATPSRGPCAPAASRPRWRRPRQKYGKQIRYAERRGIPFVWFPAGATQSGIDEVRDIRSGEQVAAEPGDWSPPPADLEAALVASSDGADSSIVGPGSAE